MAGSWLRFVLLLLSGGSKGGLFGWPLLGPRALS